MLMGRLTCLLKLSMDGRAKLPIQGCRIIENGANTI